MQQTSSNSSASHALPVPRSVFIGCYAILGGLMVYALIARWLLPLYLGEPIGIEQPGGSSFQSPAVTTTSPVTFDNRIDPNTADWPELTRLPGIGEVTAKRIVAYREEQAKERGEPVFRSAKDLGRVRGIGPKTVEAIQPHLRFED